MQAMSITVDGLVEAIKPDKGETFTLKEMQHYVNGLIEIIQLPRIKAVMIVNEDGIGLNLKKNRLACIQLEIELGNNVAEVLGNVIIINVNQTNVSLY